MTNIAITGRTIILNCSTFFGGGESMYSRAAIPVIVLSTLLWGCSDNLESNSHFTTTQGIAKKRPNILLIVADDLGYSDIGAFA